MISSYDWTGDTLKDEVVKPHPDALAELSQGEYQSDKSYRAGSIVTYNGYYYEAAKNTWNSPPSPGGGDNWFALKDRDGKPVRKVEVVN